MKTKNLELIKKYEGLELDAYLCPAGVWTIGYGHTGDVKPSQTCSKEEAIGWLKEDVKWAERAVQELSEVFLTQSQFDALVSLVFNIGRGNFASSTLLRKLNAEDYEGAADEFPKWRKAGGKVLRGLELRRAEEREMFLCGKS